MTTTQTTADQAIREARRLRRRARWADFVGGLAAVVLVSDLTWATTMVVQATTGALDGLWQVSVGLTGAAAGLAAIVAWRALHTRAGLASWAAGLAEIDTAEIVQTGLELAGQSGGSSALRNRAIARAEPGIAQVKRRVSDRWRRCAALAIAAAAMVTVTGSIATAQASLWGAMVQAPAADRSTERAVGTLVVDLQLQVTPPRYAADAARGGVYESDSVEALVGSELRLKASPMAGVSELKLVLRDADETTTALALTPNPTDGLVQWSHRLERSLSIGSSADRNGVALVEDLAPRGHASINRDVQLQQPDRPVGFG